MNFNSGMTVVVGPNGSGKSNISDAIRWVLGELSAKSVRGSKMEDVIFSGTDNRRQKAFAEVSLTIDNSDTECRLDTDLDELTVTRRCLRSGESEYMINRRPVRLRDISELFMNTGVGRTGYSIIGQGKISDIISQRSDERRSIFEEAAGISKYRYKKNETEHKLIALEENLNRVNVILDELNSRIEPLEKESQKARKYLDLYTQKKQTDVKISLYDIDIIKKQSKEIRDAHGIARLAYETANETLISLETQSEKMFDTSQENKLKAERISGKIKEYSEHRQNIINSRLVLQNDILHAKNQINQSETDLKVKIAARESALKSKKQLETDRLALKDTLTELDSQLIITKERLKTLFEQRIVLENNRETVNKQISAEQDENTALKIKLSALKNKSENHAARNTELLNEISACSESVGLIKSRIEKAELLIKDYRQKTDNLNEIIKQTDAGIESHNKELKSLNNEIDGITLELSSKKQRVDTLKRMDELFEGYAHSVRQIMQASESGKLNGIYGPVSRIIEVKPRYAVAIETAIGANIQNIVTENEESAKKAINYLKQNNAGRATFYPLSSMKAIPLNADISSFKSYPGYIAIASELVSYERRYKDVVGYMLGRTVVFDNLDNATLMAKATGYRIRIVTLDGQLINTGGSFTGGSIKKDSGILTRASETEKLSGEITRTQLSLQAKEKAYNELNTALKGYIIKREKLNEELSMLNTVYQAENTQLQVLRTQYSNDVNSLNNYKKEYNEIDLLNESNDTEIETIELTISS
ncbi:MAG: chromosome segregation protein SMC, partial [Eubacteriales bacterium]|nr:chromosome segregation protein SMC [Eubacteriales bacterium]